MYIKNFPNSNTDRTITEKNEETGTTTYIDFTTLNNPEKSCNIPTDKQPQ
jgi:hypothetical protein